MDIRQALARATEALKPAGTNFYCIGAKVQTELADTNGKYVSQWWAQFGSTTNNHLYDVWVALDGTTTVHEIAPTVPPLRYYYETNTNFWNRINAIRVKK
jgi:hypothetical protein